MVEVVDRRATTRAAGLYSERLVQVLRGGGRVVCVLNRKGRARLLACAALRRAGPVRALRAAVAPEAATCCLVPAVRHRPAAGVPGLRRLPVQDLRPGVARVREELEALARGPVGRGDARGRRTAVLRRPSTGPALVVGTEAVLHRLDAADVVAFLDFDQELLAPRYRAAEEALALLVPAARLLVVGGRSGRLLVQTRVPDHEVCRRRCSPTRPGWRRERARRRAPGLPAVGRWPRCRARRRPRSWSASARRRGSRCSVRRRPLAVGPPPRRVARRAGGQPRPPAGSPPGRRRPPPPV